VSIFSWRERGGKRAHAAREESDLVLVLPVFTVAAVGKRAANELLDFACPL
jgi:hypothetical protein